MINGFEAVANGEVVPILRYPDDTIVFLDVNLSMVETLGVLLTWFEVASGLRVNATESRYIR